MKISHLPALQRRTIIVVLFVPLALYNAVIDVLIGLANTIEDAVSAW